MAFENLYTTLSDDRLPAVLAQEVIPLLADRGRIANHPSLVYAGDAAGGPSTSIKVSAIGWGGYDLLAAVAENAAVGNTLITDDAYTVTVVRRAKSYSTSQLARLTDSHGHFSPQSFLADAIASADATLVDLLINLASGFTGNGTVGTSSADMTYANFLAATALLEANDVGGPYMFLCSPQQWADVRVNMSALTGQVAYNPATPEMVALRSGRYKGDIAGIDVMVSSRAENDGTDVHGVMFGRGALIWADSSVPANPLDRTAILTGRIKVATDTDVATDNMAVVTNWYSGVSEGIDLAGVHVRTDAP